MKLKILCLIGTSSFFISMVSMFISLRSTSPSLSLLLFYFITIVGGGILAIRTGDGKFPNKLMVLALISGYVSFLLLGFGRIAPPEDRLGFLELALLTSIATVLFSYFGLKEHEKEK